jgi:predicted aspartyl protease
VSVSTFRIETGIAVDKDGPFEPVEALVDTGASYSVVPAPLLERLGVTPIDTMTFALADGRRIVRPLGEAAIRLGDQVRTHVVIFGEAETRSLIAAFTLEAFGLVVGPNDQQLARGGGLCMGNGAIGTAS